MLSSHKDEYLLSPCTSRIWFVVELCEPVQAERIELANFELFSSSPKDVQISISNRFPTRDWTTVGKFEAKDERDIQTFELNPHLFGKFVRVEVLSHYNVEYFCPLSMFRVFGTSEFEAFETENQPSIPMDDFEDDHELKKDVKKNDNLLNRAGEAVLNIVKKAAEVLGKRDENSLNSVNSSKSLEIEKAINSCISLSHTVLCKNCTDKQHSELVDLLSCNYPTLLRFLELREVRHNLYTSDLCKNILGFDLSDVPSCQRPEHTIKAKFLSKILSPKYKKAMCNLMAIHEKKITLDSTVFRDSELKNAKHQEVFNPTIQPEDVKNLKNVSQDNVAIEKRNEEKKREKLLDTKKAQEEQNSSNGNGRKESTEIPSTIEASGDSANVNIFNVVENLEENQNLNSAEIEHTIEQPPVEAKSENSSNNASSWGEIEDIVVAEQIVNATENNVNQSAQNAQKNHPESVFLRLSNRIKVSVCDFQTNSKLNCYFKL